MKKFLLITLVIFCCVVVVVCVDGLRARATAARARTIRIGASKQQITETLGQPTAIFTPLPQARTNMLAALLSVSAETWAYGGRLELRQPFQSEFPYFMPIRFRLFQPDPDDIAIEFDSSDQVRKVTIP